MHDKKSAYFPLRTDGSIDPAAMTVVSLSADHPATRAIGNRVRVGKVTVVLVLLTAALGGPPAASSEDLYDYFAPSAEGGGRPPREAQVHAPPRNTLPTTADDHEALDRGTQSAGAPDQRHVPHLPPRNTLPAMEGSRQAPVPRPPVEPPEVPPEVTPINPPRNVLPVRSDPPPAETPPIVVEEYGVPAAPGGLEFIAPDWQGYQPVVLPQDLPRLTYMEHYCCWPPPPLILPATCYGSPPPCGFRYWNSYPHGADTACVEPASPCTAAAVRSWRAHGGGLVLVTDGGSQRRLSFSTAAPSGSLLSTDRANIDSAGGVDFAISRFMADGRSLELRFWGLFPDDRSATAVDPAPPGGALPDLNTTLNVATLDFDNGTIVQSVDNYFNGAQRHQLVRAFELNNLELNMHVPFCGTCDTTRTGWLGGLRYFDLYDGFDLWTDPLNTVWGDDPTNELVYEIDVENRLVGFQLGLFLDHLWSPVVHVIGTAKAGVYKNDVKYETRLGNIATPAVVGAGVFAGQPFDLGTGSDDVAFLGDAELGLAFDLTWQWQVAVGYRSVVLSGIALANDQIAANFNNLRQASAIDSSGVLLLHGGFARLERNW